MINLNLLLKTFLSFVVIFIILILLTKIGGPLTFYPPTDRLPMPWNEICYEIPRLVSASIAISGIAYLILYWDWYSKNKNKR
jgi:hypothetical protein